jgi:hypothetical protein
LRTRDKLDLVRDKLDLARDKLDLARDKLDLARDKLDLVRDKFFRPCERSNCSAILYLGDDDYVEMSN